MWYNIREKQSENERKYLGNKDQENEKGNVGCWTYVYWEQAE